MTVALSICLLGGVGGVEEDFNDRNSTPKRTIKARVNLGSEDTGCLLNVVFFL